MTDLKKEVDRLQKLLRGLQERVNDLEEDRENLLKEIKNLERERLDLVQSYEEDLRDRGIRLQVSKNLIESYTEHSCSVDYCGAPECGICAKCKRHGKFQEDYKKGMSYECF